MNAESTATLAIVNPIRRTSLCPDKRPIQPPITEATPVDIRAALMTKIAPLATTAWFENPRRACSTVITRPKNSVNSTPNAMRSGGTRDSAKNAMAAAVTNKTKPISTVIG